MCNNATMPFFFFLHYGHQKSHNKKEFLLTLCYACQGFYSDSVVLSIVFGSQVKTFPFHHFDLKNIALRFGHKNIHLIPYKHQLKILF